MKQASVLFLLFILYTSFKARAEELTDLSLEPYSVRPDILSIEPSEVPPQKEWTTKLLDAHFTTVANLLSLYPHQDIYFLARDGEYLFDVAKLATEGSSDAARIHLINVSTRHKSDSFLGQYLSRAGINESSLEAGKQVILIDSGFLGSIPQAIKSLFSQKSGNSLKTHLIFSGNPEYPSARTFLVHLNNYLTFLELDSRSFTSMMTSYEHLPHFTDRSTHYALYLGQYEPMSPVGSQDDGVVSKEKAVLRMQEIIAHWNDPKVKRKFFETREFVNKLRAIIRSSKSRSDIEKVKTLILSEPQNVQLVRLAQVVDFFEAMPNMNMRSRLRIEDLRVYLMAEQIKEHSRTRGRMSSSNKCIELFSK